MDVYTFGELLSTFRKHHRISQNELAEKLDMHRNTIGRWERGSGLPESKTVVLELAKQLRLNEQETRQLLEASLTVVSPYWLMPYQRNPFFTGRDSVLQQLHDALARERAAILSQSYALSGLGGIGKTQTAIEYAYRYVNEYTAVFWISSETNESIVSSFVAIAELLNLPEKQEKEQSRVIAAVTRWLTSHNDWLVVFDNVEDLELVKGVLPSARCGSLLFTSRRQALGFAAQTLDIEQMTPEEGIRFLLHRARLLDPTAMDSLAPETVALAREIVVVMDGLPLALDQAGAYIEATRCSLSDYLQLFQASQLRLLDERDTHADHPSSVTRTFALAFEHLKKNNPVAVELLTVCAFLAAEAIPETFFIEGAAHLGPTFEKLAADPFEFHTAIKALLTYSLIQRNVENKTMMLHRLVQVVLKDRMSMTDRLQWAEQVVRATNAVFPETIEVATWPLCRCMLPHAQACGMLIQNNTFTFVEAISLLFRTANYLYYYALYAQAESLFQHVLYVWEQTLGSEHSDVVRTLVCLADTYLIQGKYDQAEQLFIRVLALREQQYEADSLHIAESLDNLALLYREQGKYKQAIPLCLRVLAIREQRLEADDPQIAASLNNLANLYRFQGKYVLAESLFARALALRERSWGNEHYYVAYTLGDFALLYRDQGKYEQAEPLCQRALSIYEQQLGSDHPHTATGLNNLAVLYRNQARYEQAESLYLRSLAIREQRLGSNHPLTAQVISNLATLYRDQGQYERAEPLFLQAQSIYRQYWGIDHPELALSLNNLALLYYKQSRYEEAESTFVSALSIREQQLGADHPLTADILHNLATVREAQGNSQGAISLYQHALMIRDQALGSDHPKTNATRIAYTHLLRELGLGEEAETVEAQAQISISPSPAAHVVDHV